MAGARVQRPTMVTGGGIAVLTDTDGQTFRHQFSISAMLEGDGSARGHARFAFSRIFSLKWGAIPGVSEIIPVTELIEDALNMNAGAFVRHDVSLVRDFQVNPSVLLEKHKVLQILVNLLRNAKHACDDSGRVDRQIVVRVTESQEHVRIAIRDNGVGIPAENLTKIFSHGFTTRKEGHGFGLHSGALAAKELGGAIIAQSEGPGCGATFILELPLTQDAKAA